jgi:hypothetical protein
MANWFEDLTKTMADEKIGRRRVVRRIVGGIAGITIASALPGTSLAKSKKCNYPYTCSNPCSFCNCPNNNNNNCYCFLELDGKAVCACNSYCSQSQTCSISMKCPQGYACIVSTGCNCSLSQGICAARCKGKHKNCQLGSGHGATVAGHVL